MPMQVGMTWEFPELGAMAMSHENADDKLSASRTPTLGRFIVHRSWGFKRWDAFRRLSNLGCFKGVDGA